MTVLFADISGYTALSESLDPEDVTAIMNRLFDVLTAEITRYEGTVDKYSGDAVMALFGAPRALENHEEMAVRAALAMQEALAALSAEMEQEWGFGLRMRIGLNSGKVLAGLVGGTGARAYTVMGDTVNLASRLERACPVGRVMVSAATARPLHAIFEFEPPQQITVRGKTEPVTVYLVTGEKARRGRVRGVAGLHAPMVGRDEELAALRTTFERSLAGRCWQVATVVGEAGIGKTRLRREFVAWIAQARPETRLLVGRCYAHTQATPYYLIADLMRVLFNVGSDTSAAAALEQLTRRLRSLDPAVDETEFRYRLGSLAGVLGLSLPDDPLQLLDPEQRRDRTFLSLERLLLAASAAAALIIVVEDLHWADALSLSFIERLIHVMERGLIRDRAALLLIISRPAEDHEAPLARVLERVAQPPHHTLAIRPLDAPQLNTLVTQLLEHAGAVVNILSFVVERAQGNPFFAEEMIRSLIEDGTLVDDPATGGWRATRTVAEVQVPDTVQGVLAARLDRLPPDDKRIVQHAAIIGRTFWQRLLTETTAGRKDTRPSAAVEAALPHLETRQLVLRLSQSQIADDWEWIFRHVLTQEVAYASVPKAVRRRVHCQVARALETHAGDQAGSFIPMIAYHYERGDVPEKALEYLRRAGEQAAAQFANADAVGYFSRALALLEQAGQEPGREREQRCALLLGREGAYGLLGERESQAADLERLVALADEMDDDRRRAAVALRQAAYYEATSDFPAALEAAQEAVEWAEQAGDPNKIEGLIAWGRALLRQGAFEEARHQLEQVLALARQRGDRPGEANSLHYLGAVLYFLGDCRGARDHWEQALAVRRALGNRRGEAITLSNLVAVYDRLGDFSKGQRHSEQALAIHQTIGDRRGEAQALSNLASIHHALGNLTTARDYHERSLALFQTIGDRRGQALAAENLGLVLHDLGDDQAARRYCEQALEIERAIGDRQGEGYALAHLALALEGLGELEEAAAAYGQALQLRREIGQEALAVDDLAGLARVAIGQGQMAAALAHVEEALAWVEEHGEAGVEYPLRVYLAGVDVLTAAGQPERAAAVLKTAHTLLLEQAARISDEATRHSFLEDVPGNRRIKERLSRGDDHR
jgi:class 3 adenylate cyclase/tetratricopeptide (TPR) repeat protein